MSCNVMRLRVFERDECVAHIGTSCMHWMPQDTNTTRANVWCMRTRSGAARVHAHMRAQNVPCVRVHPDNFAPVFYLGAAQEMFQHEALSLGQGLRV